MSLSPKKQKFFELVKSVKEGKLHQSKVPSEIRKVAGSITLEDIDRFIKEKQDLKIKKAVLSTIKDCREPMYLQEDEKNIITKKFDVEGKFEEYVMRYSGIPFSEKELEAVNTFQKVKPTKIEPKQIRYETTDAFNSSTTTIIKKLEEGSYFVYVAFSKTSTEKSQEQSPGGGIGGPSGGIGGPPPIFERIDGNRFKLNEQGPVDPLAGSPPGGPMSPVPAGPSPALPPVSSNAPMTGTITKTPDERKKEMGIDTIEIKKSNTFKSDIDGGAILADFLKSLDL